MQQLILIVGNGGAGKRTNGQLLYSRLPRASWTHMRWMTAVQLWEPTQRFEDLLLRNAAAVISNYLAEGVDQAILSGGVYTQEHLDRLRGLISRPLDVFYFWLDLPDDLRADRLIGRARDTGDTPESVRELIAKHSFPTPALDLLEDRFRILDAARLNPDQIVTEMMEILRKKRA